MKCAKCNLEFNDKDLDLSHDVPKYIGGTDKDGRHYLCRKCHDIYERMVMAVMVKVLDEEHKEMMRNKAKSFSHTYFHKD